MHQYTKFWFLKDFDLMKRMGRMNLMRMCELFEMKNYGRGEEVELSANNEKIVFFLKSGTIKIISSNSGVTFDIVKKGNILLAFGRF